MSSVMIALKMLLKPKHASGKDLISVYEHAFASTILRNNLPALAFNRGRVALWTILTAAGIDKTSEVILPAYTCETVPMAVKFTGAKCVFVDVENNCFNASLNSVIKSVTQNTKAILCQHTYGIMQPVHEWSNFTDTKKVLLIEDRCQLIDDLPKKNKAPLLGGAAYYSTHFSKPYSTVQGGIATFYDYQLYVNAKRERSNFKSNGDYNRARRIALQALLYSIMVRPATRAIVGSIYRWAQRAGIIRGSISVDEYGKEMPVDYLSHANNLQAALGMEQLSYWDKNYYHRQKLTRFYLEKLMSLGVDVISLKNENDNPALLMVPLLVNNKKEILKRASTKGLPIGTWFDRCPAHIHVNTSKNYDYQTGQCPNSEGLISREIHLLTAPWVTEHQADKAMRFIEKYALPAKMIYKNAATELTSS